MSKYHTEPDPLAPQPTMFQTRWQFTEGEWKSFPSQGAMAIILTLVGIPVLWACNAMGFLGMIGGLVYCTIGYALLSNKDDPFEPPPGG